jgi:hypothetical protein
MLVDPEDLMEQTHWAVSLIIAWLPFLMFIGATFWVGHRIGRELKTSTGRPMAEVVEEFGRELKQANDLTARSVADLHMRLEALEKR